MTTTTLCTEDPCRGKSSAADHYCRDVNYQRSRAQRLKRFGLTPTGYDELLLGQGGACAVCREPEKRTRGGRVKELVVDHCHETGTVRGLLCQDCNLALGLVDDDVDRLRALIKYLEASRSNLEIVG